MRLWIDTDVGTNPDDAIALLCAAAHPAVDLIGVSTVGADAAWRADVTRHLLPEPVPIVAGAAAALQALPAAAPDAVLAIGPLTNLATLVATGWRPAKLVVMGGLLQPLRHRGRLRQVESNFAADPAAAAVVLSEPGATLVPLDVTAATALDLLTVDALTQAVPALLPTVEAWFTTLEKAGVPAGEQAVHLHDPAALLVAAGEPLARLEARQLQVDTHGRLLESAGAVHDVAVGLDAGAVRSRVLDLLGVWVG